MITHRCLWLQGDSGRLQELGSENSRLVKMVAEHKAALASQAQQVQELRSELEAQLQSAAGTGGSSQRELQRREAALRARERELEDIQAELKAEADRLARTRDALARDQAQLQVGSCCWGCYCRVLLMLPAQANAD